MKSTPERVGRLFDLLASAPEGMILDDIMDGLGCKETATKDAIEDLRLMLGNSEAPDDINVVCDPRGEGERWLYQLVGDHDRARPYVNRRLADTESRIRVQWAVARSLVKATDGRKPDGRRARLIEKGLRRLVEDLHDLRGQI